MENRVNSAKVSVIKYEGDNTTFVWRHPITDFNWGSQLIVHESQEALFFRDGVALDLFPAGRYTLETQQLPLISRIQAFPAKPKEIFHSEVYFINLTTQMGIKWGTDSRVRFLDPLSGLPLDIGACGEMNMRVMDSRKLILKLVGTESKLVQNNLIDASNETFSGAFKALVLTLVKAHLAKTIKKQEINIFEIEEHLLELSADLRTQINEGLNDYGLILPEFYITRISLPEDENFQRLRQQYADQYLKIREEQIKEAEAGAAQKRKIVEAQTEAQLNIIRAQGEAEAYRLKAEAEAKEMQLKGYTYQQETARQVGMEAMKNGIVGEGSGGLGDIASLGIALGAMDGIINMTKGAISPIAERTQYEGTTQYNDVLTTKTRECVCGNKNNTGNYCNMCGKKKPEIAETWDCVCGKKGNTGNYCNMCGKKKPEPIEMWDCMCGKKGNTGNYCDMCGKEKQSIAQSQD